MILAAAYHPVLATLFGFLALLLIVVILLQRGRGVGLAGAFGGAGGQQAFGAKTGDFLTWATIVIAAILLTFAVLLNYVFVPPPPFAPATPVVAPSDTSGGNPEQAPADARHFLEPALRLEPADAGRGVDATA